METVVPTNTVSLVVTSIEPEMVTTKEFIAEMSKFGVAENFVFKKWFDIAKKIPKVLLKPNFFAFEYLVGSPALEHCANYNNYTKNLKFNLLYFGLVLHAVKNCTEEKVFVLLFSDEKAGQGLFIMLIGKIDGRVVISDGESSFTSEFPGAKIFLWVGNGDFYNNPESRPPVAPPDKGVGRLVVVIK